MTPFSIEELRANIGNDRRTEQTLLSLFVDSTKESLQLLATRLPETPNAEYNALWKTHMHRIKGSALNLGATALCDLTAQAQKACGEPESCKKAMLDGLFSQFEQLEAYIGTLL